MIREIPEQHTYRKKENHVNSVKRYHKKWVKIYWITICTTIVISTPFLFPPKKSEEEKENETAKPVLMI